MIGLSLSLCIGDLLIGEIKEEQVDHLIVACCFCSEEELDALIEIYKQSQIIGWDKASKEEIKVLIKRMDIRQPRLQNDKHFPNIAWGHWVESSDDIIWQDDAEKKQKVQKYIEVVSIQQTLQQHEING